MNTDYKTFFRGKKITMLGLGLLGRGVNVAKFLAELGAELTITDKKTKEELTPSLKQLSKYKNIRYVLGEHRLEDFRHADMVIKAAGVPLDSPFIKEAKKNKIPVEMDASLFAKFSRATIVGVTGTRGKSTTTHLLVHILEEAGKPAYRDNGAGRRVFVGLNRAKNGAVDRKTLPYKVFIGGNVRGMATLPLLKKVKEGDIVVLESDSWQLQGFGDAKISPHISVFTNFLPDHLNYYKGSMKAYFADKANIFKYQKEGNTLIMGEQAFKEIKNKNEKIKSKVLVARKNLVPKTWKTKLLGEHNKQNIACVVLACRALGVSEQAIKRGVATFFGVPGRLEYVRTVGGVKYYNDTTATTPDGLRVALEALARKKKNVVLIAGGADKGLDLSHMARQIHHTVKGLVLIEGSATEKILALLPKKTSYPVYIVDSMKEAVLAAKDFAKRGNTVLLSPGAASFGMFKNEFDRGDQFMKYVKKL